jgi:hypothetical protein
MKLEDGENWPQIKVPLDTKFQEELLKHLRESGAPQKTAELARVFKRKEPEVASYLDLLAEGNLVQYRPIGGGQFGWVAIDLASN